MLPGTRRRLFVLAGVLLAGHACAKASREKDGLEIRVQALSSNDAGSVEVVVSGMGIYNPLSVPLYPEANGSWTGVIGAIPSGAGRTFTAKAYDNGDPPRQIYSGSVADVVIPDRGFVNVSIVMQEDGPNPGFSNHAPIIDELTTSATRLNPGDRLALRLVAHDNDFGETATLTLVPSEHCGGHFEVSENEDQVGNVRTWSARWTAPAVNQACLLTFLVRDVHGAQSLATVNIEVGTGAGAGGARVDTDLQSYPVITEVSSTPEAPETVLRPGGETTLKVVASHPDNRALTYRWSADCAGSFDRPTADTSTFALDAGSQAARCTFSVLVGGPAKLGSDGVEKRLSVVGALTVNVGDGAPVIELGGPVIDLTARSADVVTPDSEVTLVVGARETNPAATLVSYAWMSSAGTLGAPVSAPDLRSSQIVWTAPSNMAAVEVITVIVTDSQGATARTAFVIDRADPPVIEDVSSSPLPPQLNLVPGGQTALAVSVTEPSGSAVDYAWTSDCPGGFDDPSAAAPVFTLDVAASTSTCSFTVLVTGPVRTTHDGRTYRLTASGAVVISVGIVDPDPVGGPEISGVSMSDNMVVPGGSVYLYVGGREANPEAHLTGYAWQSATGSLTSIATAADFSSSLVLWTAPLDMGLWATVDVTLMDSQGATASYTFWILNASL